MNGNGAPPAFRLKKLRLAQSYLLGRPLLATWQLSRCGRADCSVCELGTEVGIEWTSVEDAERIAATLGGLGCLVVRLMGGADPFLHPDLPGVLRALALSHVPAVVTHGWMVTRERAQAAWQAGLVAASVPMHSAQAAAHDARVGLPGAHARALAALRVLADERRQPWQSVGVTMPLVGLAEQSDIEQMLDLVAPLGIRVEVEEPGSAEAATPAGGLAERLIGLKRARPNLRSSAAFLARIDQARAAGVPGCKAGHRTLHIDHQGLVWRCFGSDGSRPAAGDLKSGDAGETLARLRRASEGELCRRCWRADRGEVETLYTWRGLAAALTAWVWR